MGKTAEAGQTTDFDTVPAACPHFPTIGTGTGSGMKAGRIRLASGISSGHEAFMGGRDMKLDAVWRLTRKTENPFITTPFYCYTYGMRKIASLLLVSALLASNLGASVFSGYDFTFFKSVSDSIAVMDSEKPRPVGELLETFRTLPGWGQAAFDAAARKSISSTGEIRHDAGAGTLVIVTPRSEVLTRTTAGTLAGDRLHAAIEGGFGVLCAAAVFRLIIALIADHIEPLEKDAAVAGILRAVNSIKGATVKQEDVAWTTQEELEKTGVTITYLENGQVRLDFDASCQWNQFYYGEFLFTGMDVTGTLTNVMATGNLSITKNVERNGVTDNSGTTPFTFEIEVPTASGPYTVEYSKTDTARPTNVSFTTSGGGTTPKAQIQVYPGETVTINGLPSGVTATVKETGYDGYAPSWKVGNEAQTANYASATITAGQTIAVTCTNTTGAVLPSTGGVGTTPFLALGTLLTLGAGMLLVQRRRKEGSDAV